MHLDPGESASATAQFDVDSASGVTVNVVQSTVNVAPPPSQPSPNSPILIEGNKGAKGVNLQASATHLPAGKYQWVQLLTEDTTKLISGVGSKTCTHSGFPQLDNAYPYGYSASGGWLGTVSTTVVTNDTAQDSPNSVLPQNWGELARSFQANMYLMWAPNADSRCTDGNKCTVPVPLGNCGLAWQPSDSRCSLLVRSSSLSERAITLYGEACQAFSF